MSKNYFFDCEFIDDGNTIDLISIGIVSDDNREFYACNTEARLDRASQWVRDNVLPKLPPYSDYNWMSRKRIAAGVLDFIAAWGNPIPPFLWAWYGSYDWTVFCQLFGPMVDLPEVLPRHVMCLKQLAVLKGNPTLPKKPNLEHDALEDARWNRTVHGVLTKLPYVAIGDVKPKYPSSRKK